MRRLVDGSYGFDVSFIGSLDALTDAMGDLVVFELGLAAGPLSTLLSLTEPRCSVRGSRAPPSDI